MGMFTFLKGKGNSIFKSDEKKAQSIKNHVLELLERQGNEVEELLVEFDEGAVTLSGQCDTNKTREKAILMAGNVEGVEQVNADGLLVSHAAPAPSIPTTPVQGEAAPVDAPTRKIVPSERVSEVTQAGPESQFYTIQSGDTLSKIAKEFYGDPNTYRFIVEENTGVIENPDKIYPGQVIRIPPMSAA